MKSLRIVLNILNQSGALQEQCILFDEKTMLKNETDSALQVFNLTIRAQGADAEAIAVYIAGGMKGEQPAAFAACA